MPKSPFILKNLAEIPSVPTAHQIGLKKVLLNNHESYSNLTQIAITVLQKNEMVEPHVHPTMDEHYLFVSGEGVMCIDGKDVMCSPGVFLLIPATCVHSMQAVTDMKFLTIGVAL